MDCFMTLPRMKCSGFLFTVSLYDGTSKSFHHGRGKLLAVFVKSDRMFLGLFNFFKLLHCGFLTVFNSELKCYTKVVTGVANGI